MAKACKNCDYWDHGRGRNKAGAAVFVAPCRYSPDILVDVVFSSAQRRQYNFEQMRQALFSAPSSLMEPKDGANCDAFERRK